MSGLTDALAALSGETRRVLAHALVLALEGRGTFRSGGSDGSAEESRPAAGLMASGGTAEKSEVPGETDVPGKTGRAGKSTAEAVKRRLEGEPVPLMERLISPGGGASNRSVRTVYGADGNSVTLRREVPLSAPAAVEDALPGAASSPMAADPMRQMREISDFFRQDSRRYDPGFTRY